MRIAIVGSRGWPHPELVQDLVRGLAKKNPETVIVSGGARGVDKIAEDTARECGLEVSIHKADWKKHGRRAGVLRNTRIIEDADKVVAFWDGASRGTMDTMRKAQAAGKKVTVIGLRGRPYEVDFRERIP